jgi:HEAT repeat protein
VPVAAAFALGSIGAKDADAELRAALEKADPLLQMTAAWSLAKLHPDDPVAEKLAIEKFAQGLKSDDPAIRMAAAKNLQSLEAPPELIAPALVALLNDPHPEVRTNAIEAIASLGESVVPRAIRALQSPELRDAAIRVITRIGPKASNAVQPLVEAAGSADADTRTHIQLALAAIGPNAAPATDMLVKSIGSDDAGERESALLALRKIGPGASNAIRPLLQRMRADDSFDALAAAWALARIAPENAQVSAAVVERLSLALANNNSDEQVRLESVAALAHLGAAASSATDPLRRVAKEDSSASVRAAAEAAIAEIAPGS